MQRIPAIFLVFILATTVRAQEHDISKGFENLTNVIAGAQILDFRSAMGSSPDFEEEFLDPWGTPYRIDIERLLIAGAGSDREFDETEWTKKEQFTGLEGDVVIEAGVILRSNRNWLYQQAKMRRPLPPSLEQLRAAEILFMMMRTPEMQQITAIRLSTMAMQQVGRVLDGHRERHGDLSRLVLASDPLALAVSEAGASPRLLRDAWGTPLRMDVQGNTYVIASAGADRTFIPMSWKRPVQPDPAEDIVLEDGVFTRQVNERSLLEKSPPVVEPLAQPPDAPPSVDLDGLNWNRVGGDIKAPVVVERVEPVYPEAYRRMRLSGIVILECEIRDSGKVAAIRVVKSLAPDFDTAAIDAVHRWKFTPGTLDGRPVNVLFHLTINFKLV